MKLIFEIVAAVLISFGGASVIILGLASWLGKVWANKILEQDKARYKREIEELKNNFNKELEYYKTQLDLAKSALSRYSENQFNLYNKLWISLCELKIAGDKLWDRVDEKTVLDFAVKVIAAKENLFKNALLIEEEHYKQLTELLDKFGRYSFGKYTLIQLDKERRNNPSFKLDLGNALLMSEITEKNASTKEAYDKLLLEIKDSFKCQLKKGI